MTSIQKSLSKRPIKAPLLFDKFDLFEAQVCIQINQWGGRKGDVKRFFCVISRLGDGVFWYCLMGLFIIINGQAGLDEALAMSLIGLFSVVLYKALKSFMVRERPFISFGEITAHTAPLDRYSFPSGHSMNAACFAVLFSYFEPMAIYIVLPFAMLVAMSRVILGVHYISDVIVGILLGVCVALSGIALI